MELVVAVKQRRAMPIVDYVDLDRLVHGNGRHVFRYTTDRLPSVARDLEAIAMCVNGMVHHRAILDQQAVPRAGGEKDGIGMRKRLAVDRPQIPVYARLDDDRDARCG